MRRSAVGVAVGVALVWAAAVVVATEAQDFAINNCHSQTTCHECIQTPNCMWCSKLKEYKTEGERIHNCEHNSIDPDTFCEANQIENPSNQAEITVDVPLTVPGQLKDTTKEGETEKKIVQIRPQRMKLKLRNGVSQKLTLTYRQARDYPIDLYYLMDLSRSMLDDKTNLANLGSELALLMRNLTTQFKLGFGSFVDKVMMPYADTAPEKLERPCTGCAKPYSFRNDLPLDADHNKFAQRVRSAPISGNMDAPEGGFDALMQAMVCKERIGWRDQARHILIFSTDAKFHHAGDGRLAGIVVPNDEKCHLNDLNEYADYDKYDYPSIAQINKIAKEQNINVIFAVSNHGNLYKELSRLIDSSSYGLLDRDSGNVVHLVKEQYDKISSVVRLTDNSTNTPVSIRYTSSCKGSGPPAEVNECSNIKENDVITFDLEVTANMCPEDKEKVIVEVKTLQDNLILEIDFICDCDCASKEFEIPNAEACKKKGALICGVCSCYEGYHGKSCECSNEFPERSDNDVSLCMPSDGGRICSGLGRCSCGICICYDAEVHGPFCNCNKRRCSTSTNEECSGRGHCDCNECRCNPGYNGTMCECKDNNACKEPGSQEICSGHGRCECGKCKCDQKEDTTYTGQFCEECSECITGKCSVFRDCVQCKHFSMGKLSSDECLQCNITSMSLDNLDSQVSIGARLCTFVDEEGCYFNFTYRYTDIDPETGIPGYDIYVQERRECPEPPPVLGIVFGLVAAIVAIGLLTLLIWKLLTTIHDRREYAKFEKERDAAKWNAEENPLYRSAETTFKNPAFSQTAQ